jgi:hypothetical protein
MTVCELARKKPCRRAVRAWVLTFPFPLRFLSANHPQALTAVLAVVQRAISTFVIRHAGLAVSCGARTGAVTLIQRFGSALNLNPHLHMLFLDGAYAFRGSRAIFHRARQPTASPSDRRPGARPWPSTACRRWRRRRTIRYWPGSRAFLCTPPPFAKRINAAAWNTCVATSRAHR